MKEIKENKSKEQREKFKSYIHKLCDKICEAIDSGAYAWVDIVNYSKQEGGGKHIEIVYSGSFERWCEKRKTKDK